MKKLLAVLFIGVILVSLTGCFGMGQTAQSTADQVAVIKDASEYQQNFDGLQEYLCDRLLISKKDSSGNDLTSPLFYDTMGADAGIRYTLSNTAFVELYDYTSFVESTADQKDPTAERILNDIKDDGVFTLYDGTAQLTGVISKSGKYVIVYNAANAYDYEKITDELKNW